MYVTEVTRRACLCINKTRIGEKLEGRVHHGIGAAILRRYLGLRNMTKRRSASYKNIKNLKK